MEVIRNRGKGAAAKWKNFIAPQTLRSMMSAAGHLIIRCYYWSRSGTGTSPNEPKGPMQSRLTPWQMLEMFIERYFSKLRAHFTSGHMSLGITSQVRKLLLHVQYRALEWWLACADTLQELEGAPRIQLFHFKLSGPGQGLLKTTSRRRHVRL